LSGWLNFEKVADRKFSLYILESVVRVVWFWAEERMQHLSHAWLERGYAAGTTLTPDWWPIRTYRPPPGLPQCNSKPRRSLRCNTHFSVRISSTNRAKCKPINQSHHRQSHFILQRDYIASNTIL